MSPKNPDKMVFSKKSGTTWVFCLQGYLILKKTAMLVFLAAPGTRFSCYIAPCLLTSRPYCTTIWHALVGMVEILEVVGRFSKNIIMIHQVGASSAQNLIEAHRKWSDIGVFRSNVFFPCLFFCILELPTVLGRISGKTSC